MPVLHCTQLYVCRTLNGVDVDDNDVDMEDQSVNPVGSLIKRVQKSCLKYLERIPGENSAADRWREFLSVNCLRNHAMFGDVPVMNQSESCLNVITHA